MRTSRFSFLVVALAVPLLMLACGIRSPLDGPSASDGGGDARGDARAADAAADAPPDAAHDAPPDSQPDVVADSPADTAPDSAPDSPPDAPVDSPPDSPPDAPAVLAAPRPIAPLSTSTVTSQQPTLRWALDPGSDGAQVEICFDHACTKPVETFTAQGASGRPPIALAAGPYFWRLHGTSGVVVHAAVSPTWELFVRAHSAPVDTSWGAVPDLNADGLADAVVGQMSSNGPGVLYTYTGNARGLVDGTAIGPPPAVSSGWWGLLTAANDVDGDGYPDVVVSDAYHVSVCPGGPAGPTTAVSLASAGALVDVVTGAGDVDGDGYGDVALGETLHNGADGQIAVYHGGPGGLATTPQTIYVPMSGFGLLVAAGDFNGDGYGDVATTASLPTGTMYVYTGGPGGLSAAPLLVTGVKANQLRSVGDVNGDGYGDMVFAGFVQTDAGTAPAAYLMPGSPAGPSTPRLLTSPWVRFDGQLAWAGDFDGDGYDDVLVGLGTPGTATSAVMVYSGAPAPGLPSEGLELGYPPQTGGYVVFSGLGDVDGDGRSDVLVGTSAKQVSYFFPGQKGGPPLPWSVIEGSTSVL